MRNARAYVALALSILVLAAAPASSVRIRDLMPSFFAVESLSKTSDRVSAFKDRVLYPNPQLYDNGYAPLDDPHIAWYLASLAPTAPAIRATDAKLRESIPQIIGAFKEAFPQFDPGSVTIYLMPSMGTFDGMTKDVGGTHGLLLGVDNISQESGPPGVLIDHELFHVYHHAVNPIFFPTKTENDLYRYGIYREVWAEGLATYVSRQLNHADAATALFSTELASLSAEKTKALACFVEQRFDSHSASDATLLFEGGRHPDDLPSRGGYYIGYLVAQQLGQTMSLAQLADLKEEALSDTVREHVHALCSGSTSSQPRT